MNPFEPMARQAEWIAQNIVHNLDFVDADKLDWKPAPSANSVLEILNHVVGALKGMRAHLDPDAAADFTPATTREAAEQLLLEATQEYARFLRTLSAEDMEREVNLRFGTFQLGFAASMPVVDLIHHHGQIAYIQTLLGDTESHFDPSLFTIAQENQS